jgi:hypothetical protein
MLPDKQSGKKPVVLDNYLFAPDNVRDRPLIFRLDVYCSNEYKRFPEGRSIN